VRISNFNMNALVVATFWLLARFSKGKQKFKGDTPKADKKKPAKKAKR